MENWKILLAPDKTLLVHDAERKSSFASEDVENLSRQPLPLRSARVRVEQGYAEHETRISLLSPEKRAEGQPQPLPAAARAFLAQYVSPAVLEVFPEWQGILIECPALEEAVWVVRDHQNGRRLTQETGQPSLCLDELLTQEGKISEETQEGRSPQRKVGGGQETKNMRQKSNGIGHEVTAALTPRQEEAIAALLTGASVQAVAKRVAIGRTTLYRWLKDETFLTAYQEARRQPMAWVPGRLQRLVGKAVHTLEHILDDPEAPAPARVNAARTVLEFTSAGRELPPEDTYPETLNPRLKPKEFSRMQLTAKEERHEDNAQDLVERSAGATATQ